MAPSIPGFTFQRRVVVLGTDRPNVGQPEGGVLYRVEVAGRARSVVRAAFSSVGAVEVREESAPEEEIRA